MSSDVTIGPDAILTHMGVRGEDGLYVIGCFERRVTLYSQQVRALNLIWALAEKGKLGKDTRVLVIGAGAAGLTAAAGAAKRGARVTVLERTAQILSFGRRNTTRWLHPRIYEWPEPGSTSARAGLPLLDWTAGKAGLVIEQLEKGFEALPFRLAIELVTDAQVTNVDLGRRGARSVSWKAPGFKQDKFDIVILAVGFGLERKKPGIEWNSYWDNDKLDQDSRDAAGQRYLISGCGDGGLVDLFRVRFEDFDHDRVLSLLDVPGLDDVATRLLEIEKQARGADDPSSFLCSQYDSLAVPEALNERLRLRTDTDAVLNGLERTPYTLQASMLNRFLLSRLVARGLDYRPGEFALKKRKRGGPHVVQFVTGEPEEFHHIVSRHGPEPALQKYLQPIWAKCGGMKEINALDQTRFPLWPPDFFGPPSSTASSAPAAPNTPMYGIGATSLGAGFIGRDQALVDLHTQLKGTQDVALTSVEAGRVAAYGGGGYGKTRLATEYAYRYAREYPGGVFYAEALQRPPVSILAEMARRVSQDAPIEDLPAATQFVKWLGAPGQGAVLLVFDDVQGKPDEVEARYRHRDEHHGVQVWPLNGAFNVKIVFTTRLSALSFAQPFRVATLDDDAALSLLVMQAGKQAQGAEDAQAAKTLATKTLAGHPLGLRLAGSYIRRTKISFCAYADLMAQRGVTATLEVAATAAPGITDHDKSIRKTFDLSLEQLDAANPVDARARTILLIAATLAPAVALDRGLIGRVLAQWEGTVVREDEVGCAIARLVDDLALLEGQDSSLDVVIHPLVADLVRYSADEDVRTTGIRAALQAVRQLFPAVYSEYWQILRPGAARKWEWLSPDREAHAHALCGASRLLGDSLWVSLALALGDLHFTRSERARALGMYTQARQAARGLLQQASDDENLMQGMGAILDRLGEMYLADGERLKARAVYDESLKVDQDLAQRAPDNDEIQRNLSISYNKLGNLLLQEGNTKQALEIYEKSLAIRQRLVDKSPQNRQWSRDFSISLGNVGKVWQTQGDHAAAAEFFQQALAIRRRLATEDPTDENAKRDVSVSLDNLALVFRDQGKFDEATGALREVIAILESLAHQDPQRLEPQLHVILGHARYDLAATLLGMPADPARATEARALLLSARDLLRHFAAADRLSHKDKDLLADIKNLLALVPALPPSD